MNKKNKEFDFKPFLRELYEFHTNNFYNSYDYIDQNEIAKIFNASSLYSHPKGKFPNENSHLYSEEKATLLIKKIFTEAYFFTSNKRFPMGMDGLKQSDEDKLLKLLIILPYLDFKNGTSLLTYSIFLNDCIPNKKVLNFITKDENFNPKEFFSAINYLFINNKFEAVDTILNFLNIKIEDVVSPSFNIPYKGKSYSGSFHFQFDTKDNNKLLNLMDVASISGNVDLQNYLINSHNMQPTNSVRLKELSDSLEDYLNQPENRCIQDVLKLYEDLQPQITSVVLEQHLTNKSKNKNIKI